MRLTRHSALIGAAALMLLAASCGSDNNNSAATTAAAPTTAATAASSAAPAATEAPTSAPASSAPVTTGGSAAAASGSTLNLKTTSLGDIIVDQDGKTLYLFQKDAQGQPSVCNAGCDTMWPPLTATTVPAPGTGLDAEDISLIARADGTMQVAFYGWPLYHFANDAAPGDTNGQGIGKIWWVVDKDGNAVGAS